MNVATTLFINVVSIYLAVVRGGFIIIINIIQGFLFLSDPEAAHLIDRALS